MVLTVGRLSIGVLVFIAVVLIIIAILCGSICVMHKLRKMDAERFVTRCASTKVCYSYVMCSESIHTFLSFQLCLQLPICADFLMTWCETPL